MVTVFVLLFIGGDKRDRTADLLNAIQALSQLSYTPKCLIQFDCLHSITSNQAVVNKNFKNNILK